MNRKFYKSLGVKHLDQIELWESTKWLSNWVNVTATDSDNSLNSDHFNVEFKIKNPPDIFNFSFLLLNEKAEFIKFTDGEKKSP